MADRKIGFIIRQWLPAALGVAGIVLESSDTFSSQNTGSYLYTLLTAAFGPIDFQKFEMIHAVLRKTGHFAGYGILSYLFYRALRATLTSDRTRLWIWSVALTAAVAAGDEWHQCSLPSRTGSFHDVLLDTAGAVVAQAGIFLFVKLQES